MQNTGKIQQIGKIQHSASTRLEGTDLKSSPSTQAYEMGLGFKTQEFNSSFKKSESCSLSASASEVIKASNVKKMQSDSASVRHGSPKIRLSSTSATIEWPEYISPLSTPNNAKIQSIWPDRLESSSTTNRQNVTKKQQIILKVTKIFKGSVVVNTQGQESRGSGSET